MSPNDAPDRSILLPDSPPLDPILEAFARLLAREAGATIVASPSRQWSRAEVEDAARALAGRLSADGIGSGAEGSEGPIVGLAAPTGPAFLVGLLALRRCGVAVALCDSARPTADRRAALDRIGVRALLSTEDVWPSGPGGWQVEALRPSRPRIAAPDWAVVKFTSGSTGEPRGVAFTGAALLADEAQLASTMEITGDDRLVAALPLAHSYGFSSLALPALVRGSTLLIADRPSPFAPHEVATALDATFLHTVPAWVSAWVRRSSPPPWPGSLRRVIAAGAPLAPEVAARFRAVAGLPVQVFYGASECGGISFDRVGDAAERGSVGMPVDGVAVAIDPDSGRLEVRSPAVAVTWLPEPHPELGAGRYLTGDLATIADGEIHLLGRADDLVIVRGRNVQPREVEAALRAMEGVSDVAVVGVDGPEGPRTLLRAVVESPDGQIDRDQVIAFCRARLAEHKVPRSVVVLDQLPRTDRGKPDRAALVALAG